MQVYGPGPTHHVGALACRALLGMPWRRVWCLEGPDARAPLCSLTRLLTYWTRASFWKVRLSARVPYAVLRGHCFGNKAKVVRIEEHSTWKSTCPFHLVVLSLYTCVHFGHQQDMCTCVMLERRRNFCFTILSFRHSCLK